MDTYGQLCVGIDPHPGLLSGWGLSDDAAGLREFGERVIAAAAGRVPAVKPQVAFFEAYGPPGMQVLAELITSARQAGLLVIGDAKRGDIGSTMAAYAHAWLNPESQFAVDALTVSPYLGFGALEPAVQAAHQHGAGLFVLALTSNPEGHEVQLARRTGEPLNPSSAAAGALTVAGQIVAEAAAVNSAQSDPVTTGEGTKRAGLGSIGVVVGATTAHLAAAHGIDLSTGRPPILAPGYGAQGADVQQLRAGFSHAWPQVLVSSSRGILRAGPNEADLVSAIDRARQELR